MRVTAQVKAETRQRILDAAAALFADKGFDGTTTRDLARGAGVAEGTLFNYFASKEAIAGDFVAEAFEQAGDDFDGRRREDASLEEQLFALVASVLRRLRPCRRLVAAVLASAMMPLAARSTEPAEAMRRAHLERVEQLLAEHGRADAMQPLAAHLYWTLFTGVLAFWINDESPKQEDTLALLDQSLRLFVRSLAPQRDDDKHGATPNHSASAKEGDR